MFLLLNVWWWVILLVGLLIIPGLTLLRKATEGRTYSLSYSAVYGDLALVLGFALAALRTRELENTVLIYNPVFNIVFILVLVGGGFYLWKQPGGHGTFVDGFHNLVIVPLYGYLVIISLLVLFQSGIGWAVVELICLAIWGWFFRKDVEEDRLDQIAYNQRTGETAITGMQWFVDLINGLDIGPQESRT